MCFCFQLLHRRLIELWIDSKATITLVVNISLLGTDVSSYQIKDKTDITVHFCHYSDFISNELHLEISDFIHYWGIFNSRPFKPDMWLPFEMEKTGITTVGKPLCNPPDKKRSFFIIVFPSKRKCALPSSLQPASKWRQRPISRQLLHWWQQLSALRVWQHWGPCPRTWQWRRTSIVYWTWKNVWISPWRQFMKVAVMI